jgi:pimeloyl-ACP methyl ester carboxylesterase
MATYDEIVTIDVDDQQISGTFVATRTRLPGVLFVHGWGGSQQRYVARARELATLGCVCLTFDLRGHEQTRSQFETVSREDNLHDVMAAFDALAAHDSVDANAIAVVGSSYGGYLAAILTSVRRVKWLALRAPALYKDSEWELPKWQLKKLHNLDEYRKHPVPPSESRALAACTQFGGDVLIVESEHDFVVPHQVLMNYREACGSARSVTYRVMAGADHGLAEEAMQHAYTSLLVEWFRHMLTEPAVTSETAVPVA